MGERYTVFGCKMSFEMILEHFHIQVDLGMYRLLERLNAAVLLAATTRERRLRGDSALIDVSDVTVEPSEPVITANGKNSIFVLHL